MESIASPLSHHAVLLLLAQLAVMLGLARTLAELLKRLRQPPVVGELLAGILLGPTGLGHLAPQLHHRLFPGAAEPMHLVETVAWIGMTLLMLLTGMETDVRLLRHLGRPAIFASVFGMAVPFASGLALGFLLPASFVPGGVARGLFASFVATAMAISAMPVISRILLDLKLVQRDIGVLILSAGVVDDTTGWLILSVISGAATEGVEREAVLLTLVGVALFLLAARYLLYPVGARLLRWVDDEQLIEGTDLTLIVTIALVSAAITQAIGIHAVFGAFVAGVVLRQAPRLRTESIERIETVTLSVFSPIFFAFVGLRVDLWSLPGPGIALVFIAVATSGKLVGCYAGGRLGGMNHWESLVLGVAMNARGAMELVVATLGLSLGILDQRLFSTLVLVALTTSFAAPLLLAPLARRLPVTPEEKARIEQAHRPPLFASALKVLTAMGRGVEGVRAFELALHLASGRDSSLVVLDVTGRKRGLFEGRKRSALVQAQLDRVREAARKADGRVTIKQVSAPGDAQALRIEAERGAGLIVLGATSFSGHVLPRSNPIAELSGHAPCPVGILRTKRGGKPAYLHLLVPTDGSPRSRLALEVALLYASSAGARLTVLHVMEGPVTNPLLPHRGLPSESARRMVEVTIEKSLQPMLELLPEAQRPAAHVLVVEASNVNQAIAHETQVGPYDLLVLHAASKAVQDRLFFGYGTEFLVEEAACSVLVVLPPGE